MAEQQDTILIDVQFDYSDAQYGVLKFKEQLDQLKKKQAELKREFADGNVTNTEYTLQMAELNAKVTAARSSMNSFQKELTNAEKIVNAAVGSYEQLNSELNLLRESYKKLSEEERKGAKGTEMLEHMQQLDTQLKSIDSDMGQYFRNVGNYPSAIQGLMPGFDQLNKTLGAMGVSLEDLSTKGVSAFSNLGKSATSFGKIMITPPIIVIAATLSAILLVFNKVSDAIKKNDDTSTSLQKSFATLQPVVTALNKVFDGLATVLAKIVEVGAAVLSTVLSIIPGFKEAASAAQEYVQALDDLQERERVYTKESAARMAEVSELRNKANNSEEYSVEQRKQFLEQALNLLRQDSKANIENLEEHVRLLKIRAQQEQDTSDATKDAIAQAEAARDEATRNLENNVRMINRQLNTLKKSTTVTSTHVKSTITTTKSSAEEAAKKLEELQKQLRDQTIEMLSDEREKAAKQVTARYDDEIAALRKRLETEKDLTEESRSIIQTLIKNKEVQLMNELDTLQSGWSEEEFNREVKARQEAISLRVSAAVKGSREEYDARLELLDSQREAELRNAELTEQERLNIEEKYRQQRESAEKSFMRAQMQALQNSIKEGVEKSGAKGLRAEKSYISRMIEAMEGMSEEMRELAYGSVEGFNAEMDKLKEAEFKATQELAEQNATYWQSFVDSMSQMFGSLGDVMDAFGADSRAMVIAEQATALIEVALKQGMAIAEAIYVATHDPTNVTWAQTAAKIVLAVATVTAQFASVVSNIKNATSGSYATGGIIPGSSEKGDKLIARVNSGEMILNKEQQAATYSALTGSKVTEKSISERQQQFLFTLLGGGVSTITSTGAFATGGIVGDRIINNISELVRIPSYELTARYSGLNARDLKEALADMPSPVLEYSEFKRFQNSMNRSIGYAQIRKR